MPIVLVQCGHEAPREPGFGGATGTPGEVELVKAIQRRLVAKLRRHGSFRAIPVPGDIPDGIRVDAALFLHADGAASSAARGFSFGYPPGSAGKRLADEIRKEFLRIPGHPPERSDNYTSDMSGYYGYRRVNAKFETLVEHGFLTNPTERAWLKANVDRIATAEYRALCRLFGLPARPGRGRTTELERAGRAS